VVFPPAGVGALAIAVVAFPEEHGFFSQLAPMARRERILSSSKMTENACPFAGPRRSDMIVKTADSTPVCGRSMHDIMCDIAAWFNAFQHLEKQNLMHNTE
jgi:hypothetical protein